MSLIRWKSFTAADSLCATCVWGTVRKGSRSGESETFCRFISPNTVVPFPVRTCTDYTDRRAPSAPADTNSTNRRFGFVTTLSLHESAERVSDSDPSAMTNNQRAAPLFCERSGAVFLARSERNIFLTCYCPCRNCRNSSRVNPASFDSEINVPFGISRL